MKPVALFFVFFFAALQLLDAQSVMLRELPKPARKMLADFLYIPGGQFVQGVFEGRDSLFESVPKEVAVEAFLMNRYEITTSQYMEFAHASGDPLDMPDTTVWRREFSTDFDEPMWRHYFHLNFFERYPAVCVSWEQANRYCQWKTKELHGLLENTPYEVEIRLPKESEWEYAALGGALIRQAAGQTYNSRIFPWDGIFMDAGKSCGYKAHCNSGPIGTQDYQLFAYPYDGGLFTVKVEAYEPNGFGLFQMAGNVAEWTADELASGSGSERHPRNTGEANPAVLARPYAGYKIIKGGSWNDNPFYMQCGARRLQPADQGSFTIGFRPVCIIRKKG